LINFDTARSDMKNASQMQFLKIAVVV